MPRYRWAALAPLILVPMVLAFGDDEKPVEKPTIKSIMKVAFKDGLARKVATGKSTAEESAEFLKLSKALQELKPPQGEEESWTEKTRGLVEATQAVIDKKEEGAALFRNATNCMSCHEIHKPK
jgi:mono/diheme cytochrome c family protein